MFRRHHDLLGLFPSWIGAAALVAVLLVLPCAVSAQQTADDVVVIEEEGGEAKGSFVEKHVFGSVGGSAFSGSPVSRNVAAARVGIDYPFTTSGGGKLYIEGGYARRSVPSSRSAAMTSTWSGTPKPKHTCLCPAPIGGIRGEIIPRETTDDRTQATRDLYEWIVNENAGRGYVDVDLLMAGAGFDALYDHWRFGASGFLVSTMLSAEAKEADRLVQAAYDDDDGVGFDSEFLPNAYVFYDFDEERTSTAGFIGRFAGPFLGLSVFYSSTWLDNLRWTASLDHTVALSDQLLDELNSDPGAYELEDSASVGGRLGVLYEF